MDPLIGAGLPPGLNLIARNADHEAPAFSGASADRLHRAHVATRGNAEAVARQAPPNSLCHQIVGVAGARGGTAKDRDDWLGHAFPRRFSTAAETGSSHTWSS